MAAPQGAANWQQLGGGNTVTYAPQGAVFPGHNGGTAFTHGVEIGVVSSGTGNLERDTEGLLRSFAQLLNWQPGFDRNNLVMLQVFNSSANYPKRQMLAQLYQRATAELRELPGVISAGAALAAVNDAHR